MRLVTAMGLVTLALGAAGSSLAEDKLVLKDGQVVTGEIVSEGDADIEIKSKDETIRVPTWAIEKIERDGSDPAPARREAAGKEQEAAGRGALSPDMKSWIDICIKHLGSSDPRVREGAMSALMTAGPLANSALHKASESQDQNIAMNARQLIMQNKRVAQRSQKEELSPLELQQERKTSKMVRSLGLDGNQRLQFEDIMRELYAAQREIADGVQDNSLSRESASAKYASLREETERKLTSVLNDEQMKQYRTLMPGEDERNAARSKR